MRTASNTKSRGTMHFLLIKEEAKVLGVCLDFNIIEEGKNILEVRKNLENAAFLHLQTVREKKLSDNLLNRHASEKYWRLFELALDYKAKKEVISATASPYFKNKPALISSLV